MEDKRGWTLLAKLTGLFVPLHDKVTSTKTYIGNTERKKKKRQIQRLQKKRSENVVENKLKITMKPSIKENHRVRRGSGTYSERVIFYVDDLAVENCQSSTPELYYRTESSDSPYRSNSDCVQLDDRSALYPPPAPDNICLELDDRFTLYTPIKVEKARRNSSCSQSNTNRRSSHNLDVETRSSRRSSVQSSRSRANSSGRPTPLGDGRRASVSKKNRTRRSGTTRRKDSVRPTKFETKEAARKVLEDEQDTEQSRRHRRIAMIVLGTFLFLLAASVLVVVVTLTHSSFLSPPTGPKDLIKHRAQLRKENEELLNSLNRDTFVPVNATVPP
ncbi:PREDICTED: uncharacterized protein LOC106789322 isoform X3 [Polistes canadensis]|uniref:uncharacterized protein LOC106789322 isoform X3 n=1 Tax=Polistes canadensis TaxID=91411 RepID=UPI000718BF27|nr:PREDICTED: uncharacterized protein LOC106789322 isoform X3 [Polistes canadensis]